MMKITCYVPECGLFCECSEWKVSCCYCYVDNTNTVDAVSEAHILDGLCARRNGFTANRVAGMFDRKGGLKIM